MNDIQLRPYQTLLNQRIGVPTTLLIEDSSFAGVAYQEGQLALVVKNCDFKKVVIENKEAINFETVTIGFFDCVIENISIESIVSENVSIGFYNCIMSGVIRNEKLLEVSFNNCILRSSVFLTGQNTVTIRYTEENIVCDRWNALFARNSISDFRAEIGKKQTYHIENCKKFIMSTNHYEGDEVGEYVMDHPAGQVGYRLTANEKDALDINLSIKYLPDSKDVGTSINNSILKSITLKGKPNGVISIESTTIDNWYIHDFLPKEEVTFYNISPREIAASSSQMEFRQSNLDKVRFDNIDFDAYSVVSFYRTRFAKSTFSSCNFPVSGITFAKFKTLENVHYQDVKPENFYKDQYELFLQLRYALESGGNFYEAQKLQAISNDALRRVRDVKRWDKLILWVNGWSNDHGLSISRPFFFLFLFSILFYLSYLFSLGRLFTSQPFDSSLVGYYFSFIDLTHRPDFLVGKDEFTGWSLGFDFLNKLLVGFFIFQFVAAFRKYGRR